MDNIVTCINQISTSEFEQGVLEHMLVLCVEPRGLRWHFVDNSHVRHQLVIQQIFHEITANKTASCANVIRLLIVIANKRPFVSVAFFINFLLNDLD